MVGSRNITLQFSVNWLASIMVLAVVLVLLFIFGPATWRPILIFTAPVLGGAGALIVAFNAVESRTAQVQQAKKAAALEFNLRWLDPALFHAKKNGRQIVKYFKDHPHVEEQKRYLDAEPVLLANLLDVLNIFEAMSIAVQMEMADEEILKRAFRSLVVEYWHVTGDFVKGRRAERQNARLFQDLEWLFNRWKT